MRLIAVVILLYCALQYASGFLGELGVSVAAFAALLEVKYA